jgi:hypothetical protein
MIGSRINGLIVRMMPPVVYVIVLRGSEQINGDQRGVNTTLRRCPHSDQPYHLCLEKTSDNDVRSIW